jgi:hypothetical protein
MNPVEVPAAGLGLLLTGGIRAIAVNARRGADGA